MSWTATYWAYYVGLREGLFANAGLEVELVTLGATAAGVEALLAEPVEVGLATGALERYVDPNARLR